MFANRKGGDDPFKRTRRLLIRNVGAILSRAAYYVLRRNFAERQKRDKRGNARKDYASRKYEQKRQKPRGKIYRVEKRGICNCANQPHSDIARDELYQGNRHALDKEYKPHRSPTRAETKEYAEFFFSRVYAPEQKIQRHHDGEKRHYRAHHTEKQISLFLYEHSPNRYSIAEAAGDFIAIAMSVLLECQLFQSHIV